MRCILIGPPGSGKGTISAQLQKKYQIPHISTGDIFREHKQSNSEFGQLIASYIDKGQLVPDEVVMKIVFDRLEKTDCQAGFLFDGFPRTLAQGRQLQDYLSKKKLQLDCTVLLEADDDLIISRLCTRRVCACGAVYNTVGRPPKVEGVCDECGQPLIHRRDDTEEVIRERLNVYRTSTEPLVSFYNDLGVLLRLNAGQDSQQVLADFEHLMDKK